MAIHIIGCSLTQPNPPHNGYICIASSSNASVYSLGLYADGLPLLDPIASCIPQAVIDTSSKPFTIEVEKMYSEGPIFDGPALTITICCEPESGKSSHWTERYYSMYDAMLHAIPLPQRITP